jgi:two-component system aerobic respiration control sensor histidine kinase ArcB
MKLAQEIINFIFGIGLFINALLFIPQAIRIFKTRSTAGVSFFTFLGFLLIQLTAVLYGLIYQDYILAGGYFLSMVTCSMVIFLIIYYQHPKIMTAEIPTGGINILERLEMLENIIALMPGHVYWVDKEGAYLGCNDNQAKSAGLNSRKEIIGKSNRDLPWNINRGVLPEALDRINIEVIRTGKAVKIEEPALLRDGTEAVFLSHKVPLWNGEGRIIGMVGISIDMTEAKKSEEELILARNKAETANQTKTEFLENMRHDIRTSVSGMVGLSALLYEESDSPKVKQYTHELKAASQELLQFLNEILESLNVASGEIPLLKKKFSLKTILEKVIQLNKPKAIEKHLNLELSLDEKIPAFLMGDPIRIYRIVLELLVNALKFTHKGYVKIVAKIAKEEEGKIVLQIEVEDTGPGIRLEKQSELFIRFKRLSPSYQGIYQGTGLGLSIVKQFIDELEGEIDYSGGYGKGGYFICLIPVRRSLL